jgi:hypothetical protein
MRLPDIQAGAGKIKEFEISSSLLSLPRPVGVASLERWRHFDGLLRSMIETPDACLSYVLYLYPEEPERRPLLLWIL